MRKVRTFFASTSNPTPIRREQPKRQTAKEVIAANLKSLIEQLEAGHSAALTAYLNAKSRFHNYSFGDILEIARRHNREVIRIFEKHEN
jgi:hypothetical protein